MIVATAGHIDHGKTSLVRALTGVDTDRLPEEKARGISIDLGFAYLPVEGGGLVGFVDVPGHERFVRNMLAGVSGIDLALVVVAADDGVMPQTVEHLAILRLLGLQKGIVAITKTDIVAPDRTREVELEVRAAIADTPFADARIFEVSAPTGRGVDALREALAAAARAHVPRWRKEQHLRFAVDRVFSVAGSGTVVTGTVFNGQIAVGARCVIAPQGISARARGIEVHGMATERAHAGMRCALNLAGVEACDVARGDWVVAPDGPPPSQRLDATLCLLGSEARALAHQARVHLHLGTADVMARVFTRRGAPIAPSSPQPVRIIVERPISAIAGDRFIVRDPSARRTLGGGVIVDPSPRNTRRTQAGRDTVRDAFALAEPRATLAALLAIPQNAVDVAHLAQAFDLDGAYVAQILREADAVLFGRDTPTAISAASVGEVRSSVLARLVAFHAAQPTAPGIAAERLRKEAAPFLPREAFLDVVRGLAVERKVELANSIVRASGHRDGFSDDDAVLWQRIVPKLHEAGASPPLVGDLARDLGVKEASLVDLLERKRRARVVWPVSPTRFYLSETLARLAATAANLAHASDSGQFTAAQYRDAIGTGRTVAIQVLELFDRLGVTLRQGDLRRPSLRYADIVGDATPLPARAAAAPREPIATARPRAR